MLATTRIAAGHHTITSVAAQCRRCGAFLSVDLRQVPDARSAQASMRTSAGEQYFVIDYLTSDLTYLAHRREPLLHYAKCVADHCFGRVALLGGFAPVAYYDDEHTAPPTLNPILRLPQDGAQDDVQDDAQDDEASA